MTEIERDGKATETGGGLNDNAGKLVQIRLPLWWTFGGLVAGLLAGWLLVGMAEESPLLMGAKLIGELWLRALQMTIIPLVAALLIVGIAKLIEAARAGAIARRMLALVFGMLLFSGIASAILMPLLLDMFPPPDAASAILDTDAVEPQAVPGLVEFLRSLIAPNIIGAAADTAMLPLTIFFAIFAVALTRLPGSQKTVLLRFFHALANTMLIIIGWVLWLAPLGVFALAIGVSVKAGGGAFVALAHYILTVSAMGLVVLVAAYLLGILGGRTSPVRFVRAMLPAQAVAISTQSSLASLPAMLSSARTLKLHEETADFVLPLSVAIFRATSPAMNLAVAIYIATLAGIELGPVVLMAGVAVAFIISIGSVSLPGSISFVISIGPIAIAMGIPVEPLALLVAVEMIPDIMRTFANVTADVAVTASSDRKRSATVHPAPQLN
ncbi:Proton glutamate symport protein [Alteripontixanthobacter maritimus]|uniref:Proton glutamate symport protein n=1 Tax=Alteripontixanthobacter maritimus TaxID=2161824 RepID=A0A369Q7U2_9SPHN|nr:cation:dicarboxylase symporter family transporter [Alteripontixanthobacter maritimus]RDC60522.1 Proton glutamate symport protein [Alteripontixanthobacter maritimus]